MFKYQNLIDLLPVESITSTINEMVKCFDMTGKCYVNDSLFNEEQTFKNYFSPSENFLQLIDRTAKKECDEDIFAELSFFKLSPDKEKEIKKCNIYKEILDYFALEAKKKSENRSELRIASGDKVLFKECMYAYKYLDKIEFYKDGGWGIAEENGTVIIKNHLMKQPKYTYPIKTNSHCPYRIIQDRDTKKFGVMSVLPIHEALLCHYEKIEVVEYMGSNKKRFFLKVKHNDKWGCFDENCALLIDCKYDDIEFKYGFFEGVNKCENGYYLEGNDNLNYSKVKCYLYDSDGNLIIGGYSSFEMEMNYMKFYFGTFYENYYVEEKNFYGDYYDVTKKRQNYSDSICLVLDNSFKSIIMDNNGFFKIKKGLIFDSKEHLMQSVPVNILFRYKVDLSNINKGFIILNDFCGEQYFIPYYILRGFETPELYDSFLKKFNGEIDPLASDEDKNQYLQSEYKYDNDQYVDDSLAIIIKIDKEHKIEWFANANEIYSRYNSLPIYRVGNKCGFIQYDGLKGAFYDGISLESPDEKVYVAYSELIKDNIIECNFIFTNPYRNNFKLGNIRYYEVCEDGHLVRVENNGKIFNPQNYKWFPRDFAEKIYNYDIESASGTTIDNDYEWTDEDAWDAMTDGMYGDYPGSGWDPEMFGY